MQHLFRSKNKSQASIDRLPSSRSSSPDPSHSQSQSHSFSRSSYVAGGATATTFADRPGFPPQSLQPQPVDDLRNNNNPLSYQQQQDTQGPGVPHPAHVLTRVPSEGVGYVDSRRPSSLAPPISPLPPGQGQGLAPAPIPGQTQFGQSKQVHVPTEKEHKRSKRSIFGLSSSKDKEKDRDRDNQHSPVEKKGVLGRSGSIHLLRKSHHQSQPSELHSPTSPHGNVRQSAYFGRSDQSLDDSPEDPSHYEQYRNQQQYQPHPQPPQQQQHQQQYDSPTSQYSQRSPEDAQYYTQQPPQHHYPPPPDKYQPYQQPESSNNSEHYLPYQQGPAQGRPAGVILAEQNTFRPPSQTSLGPPSPVAGQPADSRPSTAQTSRYSAQSVGQQPTQHLQMARGEPPNGSSRQQMPQRDPREEHLYQQDPRIRMSQHQPDHGGRNTPPPRSSNREDPRDLDYNQLLQKHEELQAKYSKVKRYYFEREAQVTQLQNTVATQRLSMSKTSLDDAQYAQRFERLSGAINNLAFNIRKDWKKVPPWLQPVCNIDAHNIGTKEMTAVGRTCITRWLNDTLFRQTFHPGIPTEVSAYLKAVEQNLRSQSSSGMVFTDEQRDDHLNKLTTWRLTTIEGLAPYLNSKEATTYQDNLTTSLTNALTGSLQANLKDPPPPGLHEGVATIISQAVSIAANIPLESRDVVITYFMPGEPINEMLMKLESGMTALTNPGQDPATQQQQQQQQQQQRSNASTTNTTMTDSPSGAVDGSPASDLDAVEEAIREAAAKATQSGGGGAAGGGGGQRAESVASSTTASTTGKNGGGDSNTKGSRGDRDGGRSSQKGSSFLGGFVSKKPTPQQQQVGSGSSAGSGGGQRGAAGQGVSRERLLGGAGENTPQERGEEVQLLQQQGSGMVSPQFQMGEGRIRFAAFLAVEVRGKIGGSAAAKEGGGGGGEGGAQQTGDSAAAATSNSAGAGVGGGGGGGGGGAGKTAGSGAGVNVLYKAPVYEL